MSKAYMLAILIAGLLPAQANAELNEFKVNTDGGLTYQAYSACATVPGGGFVVAWEDGRNGTNDIYLQRFNAGAVRQGSNVRVNDSLSPEQAAPAVTIDAGGQIWVAWQDYRASGHPINADIYIQRLDASGVKVGTNFMANDDGSLVTQKEVDIACNSNEVILVWSDLRSAQWDIYAQRYDQNGLPLGTNFILNDDVNGAPQHAPAVAALSDGRFVVVWYDNRFGNDDIFYQIISAQGGTLMGANTKTNNDAGITRQVFPSVCSGPGAGFTVAWQDYRNGVYPAGSRVYAQHYAMDAAPDGVNFLLSASDNDQSRPRLAADVAGNRVVDWEENEAGTQRVKSRLYPQGEDSGLAVVVVGTDSAQGSRSRPRPTLGFGGLIHTWSDLRNGNFDVYAATETYSFPTFLIAPASISFQVIPRSVDPIPSQIVSASELGAAPVTVGWMGLPAWLTVLPATAATPDSFTFDLGTYPGSDTVFTVWSLDLADSSLTVPLSVNIDVLEPVLVATPPSVSFMLDKKDTGSVTVFVTNTQPGPLQWYPTVPTLPWSVIQYAGDSMIVQFIAPNGNWSTDLDTIWIIDSLALNSPLAVPLEASPNPIPPVTPSLIATPAEATWLAAYGRASAFPFTIELTTIPDSAIAWSVTDWPAWLSVDNPSGVTASSLVIRPGSDTLPMGFHIDTLIIESPDASNTPLEIPLFLTIDVASDVAGQALKGAESSLGIAPNPFNASMLAQWTQAQAGNYTLHIYNLLGRQVITTRGFAREGETVLFVWRPDREVASGTYLMRLLGPDGIQTARMLYLK